MSCSTRRREIGSTLRNPRGPATGPGTPRSRSRRGHTGPPGSAAPGPHPCQAAPAGGPYTGGLLRSWRVPTQPAHQHDDQHHQPGQERTATGVPGCRPCPKTSPDFIPGPTHGPRWGTPGTPNQWRELSTARRGRPLRGSTRSYRQTRDPTAWTPNLTDNGDPRSRLPRASAIWGSAGWPARVTTSTTTNRVGSCFKWHCR